MTILFDATRTVKPARRFGRGILPTLPSYRTSYTADDASWLADDDARCDQAARELDRRVDELFEETEATRRLEAGLCC